MNPLTHPLRSQCLHLRTMASSHGTPAPTSTWPSKNRNLRRDPGHQLRHQEHQGYPAGSEP